MSYVDLWFRAFVVTAASEGLLLVPLLRKLESSWLRRAACVLLANLASHPAVWFVFTDFGLTYAYRFALSEAWAVAVEVLAYRLLFSKLTMRKALLLSLAANALSVSFGLTLRSLGVRL
ncbi:MAG: hypothetical protein R3B13_34585 [Polyangiaceae bacterium]